MTDQQFTLTALRASADELARELDRLPGEAALWRAADSEWSQHECLMHLLICEHHIFLPRLKAMATLDNPHLPLVDEAALMKAEWNPERPRSDMLAEFMVYRHDEYEILEQADWARPGVHAARGPVTLGWMAHYTLAHTYEHLSQMMRVRLYHAVRKA